MHAAKEGELDAGERALLDQLHIDGQRTHRQTLFVLSQVDQLSNEAELAHVIKTIHVQVPELSVYPVFSIRYRKGLDGAKPLLTEKSGIPALNQALREACTRVPAARAHETALRHQGNP